jgi:hypothetical protein
MDNRISRLLRMRREPQTLIEAFYERAPVLSEYYRAKVAVDFRQRATLLMGKAEEEFPVARWDGRILRLGCHQSGHEYDPLFMDELFKCGLRWCHEDQSDEIHRRIGPAWAHDWYTLAYRKGNSCSVIRYPFVMDLWRLSIRLPQEFFAEFVMPGTDRRQAKFDIIVRLNPLLAVPKKHRLPVANKVLEMKLDAATR